MCYYSLILLLDPKNKASVEEIQKSLFLVCLDGPMPFAENENRQTVASKQFIHGGGSCGNAGNRWYDKTVQVSFFFFSFHYLLLVLY